MYPWILGPLRGESRIIINLFYVRFLVNAFRSTNCITRTYINEAIIYNANTYIDYKLVTRVCR